MKMYAPRRRSDDRKEFSKTRKALITASTTVAIVATQAVNAYASLPSPKRW